MSLTHQIVHFGFEILLGGGQVLLSLNFLFLLLFDSFVDLLHCVVSVLGCIFQDLFLFFFSLGPRPKLDLFQLLLFILFDLLFILLHKTLIEVNDHVKLNQVVFLQHRCDLSLADLLVASVSKVM